MTGNTDHLGQIFGEYHLLRWLGGGGSGEVYLGEHLRDQTLAAVKVLHAHLTDPIELKAFINEARTIRLKHPNIVSLLDFGIGTNDIPFLVMEYAPYGTLRTQHPRSSRLPLSTIMAYVNPLASALQYAHDLHLVHRDVKPENMLIGADSQILLSDFGIATLALNSSSSQGPQSLSGTIPYMAPEQLEGKPHPASDQYALAIVIYEWLSGTRPFMGTTTEIAVQHSYANPPSLCEKLPYLSHEVEQVVMTALAKDPRQRFASIEAFAAALGAVAQTAPIFVLSPTNAITKMLIANEVATRTMPTDLVLESQLVDAAAAVTLGQSGPAASVVVTQTPPSALFKPLDEHPVFSKRKTITVAGLAVTLLVIALLLTYSFTSGVRLAAKHIPTLAVSTTSISKTTIPSTTVPTIEKTAKTAVPPIRKTATPQEPTLLQPTPQPTLLQPTSQPTVTALHPTPQPHGIGSIRIDSGGSGAGLFVADEDFSNTTPGRPSSASNNAQSVIDTSSVSNSAPQSIYQSFRVGDCLYTIPSLTPSASYTVRLHFAEIYWTHPGQRIFTVTLNGQVALSNFDIIATAGAANKALVEQFIVHADSTGTITIQFQTIKDNAQINAIEVLAA